GIDSAMAICLSSDRNVFVSVDPLANVTKHRPYIPSCTAERICIDGQWPADDNQRRTVFLRPYCLFDREPSNRTDGDVNRLHDVTQTVERRFPGKITFGAKRTVIVPDVVYDVVTSQIGQDAGAFDWVRHGHRIAHHLDPQVTPRLYDQLD